LPVVGGCLEAGCARHLSALQAGLVAGEVAPATPRAAVPLIVPQRGVVTVRPAAAIHKDVAAELLVQTPIVDSNAVPCLVMQNATEDGILWGVLGMSCGRTGVYAAVAIQGDGNGGGNCTACKVG